MKAIVSSLMLLFFLIGQVNLTLAAHYCGDELKSAEVTVAPEKTDCCGEGMSKTADPDCCSDNYTSSDSDDYFGKSQLQVELSPVFIVAYVLTVPTVQSDIVQISNPGYLFPDRPLPDLTILYQSFLI